ncbi:MAG: aryl-sulfate sulfotransferase [Burkholderiales bacterium]|nr:aryl-sulfate sulfotransferase [Burkholderiales bacterium]
MRGSLSILAMFFAVSGCDSGQKNLAPTVSITGPSEVVERTSVALKSSAADIDGEVVSYRWTQRSGPTVDLNEVNTPTLDFTAPSVGEDRTLVFELTVSDDQGASTTSTQFSTLVKNSLADLYPVYNYQITESDQHSSVFISSLLIDIDPSVLQAISFTIAPRQHSVADPLYKQKTAKFLQQSDSDIILPIYGLYSDYTNIVELEFEFKDGSSSRTLKEVVADVYEDNPIRPTVKLAASINQKPSFSYFYLKSRFGVHILDIDGNVRWTANLALPSNSSIFDGDGFKVFVENQMHSLDLSGSTKVTTISHLGLSDITAHHDVDFGKAGFLVEIDADKEGHAERIIESILLEVDSTGTTIKEWDFGLILRDVIQQDGYDPSNFVRDGVDWFHMNSAIYDPSDDSIVASSRENFVVKIDYDSGEVKWLLGDETKHWYVNYPSLQALSLSSPDIKPIGQHALSIVDGELMLFNNGQLSFNSPAGEPRGEVLTSSPASRYAIDPESMEAEITWNYDPFIYSDICSSIFRDHASAEGDYLVHYSAVDRLDDSDPKKPTRTIIRGINHEMATLFELELPTRFCQTAWQSRPMPELSMRSIE